MNHSNTSVQFFFLFLVLLCVLGRPGAASDSLSDERPSYRRVADFCGFLFNGQGRWWYYDKEGMVLP